MNSHPPNTPRTFAVEVVRRLRHAGYEAYWAGGCVRDALRGVDPKDYDVATNARPEQIIELFGRRRTLTIGQAFGVVAVRGPKGCGQIEVATFREDLGYSDGRHPDRVVFSTAKQDALRRDFTINGLFYDPLADQTIDYVEGQDDLSRELIRCIGEPGERFGEDRLRMLRAVRFATTLGFEIDPQTLLAIRQQADEIEVVSAERIATEMRTVLSHPNRSRGLELLRTTGLQRTVLPEYDSGANCQENDTADAAWDRLRHLLRSLQTSDFCVALAAVLWPVVEQVSVVETVERVVERWRLSNVERRRTIALLRGAETLRQAHRLRWADLQPTLVDPDIEHLIELSRAICCAFDGNDDAIRFAEQRLTLAPEQLNPPPLVDGNDLKQVGIPPGPHYQELLKSIRDHQLEGELTNRSEALQFAMQAWKGGLSR